MVNLLEPFPPKKRIRYTLDKRARYLCAKARKGEECAFSFILTFDPRLQTASESELKAHIEQLDDLGTGSINPLLKYFRDLVAVQHEYDDWKAVLKAQDEQLVQAVKQRNINQVQSLLRKGAWVNIADESGDSLLHLAVVSGNDELVRLLLEFKAEKNGLDKGGATPLIHAILGNDITIVKILLDFGADPNDRNGQAPLIVACDDLAPPDIIRALVEAGADTNCKTQFGTTPLHIACDQARFDVVKILLKGRANPNARDKRNETPLHVACQYSIQQADSTYLTVQTLLEADADPNIKNDLNHLPIEYAYEMNDSSDIVSLLIKAGSDTSMLSLDAYERSFARYGDRDW